jgi:hypothetical protein
MIAGPSTHDQAPQILERCIAAYNAGVRTRDFRSFLALLTEDAQLDFEGVPDRGPLVGKEAIRQHFADDPPDDQVRIERWKINGSQIVAEFSWMDIPESGGCLILGTADAYLARMTIVLGGPRRRFR